VKLPTTFSVSISTAEKQDATTSNYLSCHLEFWSTLAAIEHIWTSLDITGLYLLTRFYNIQVPCRLCF